MTNAWWKPLYDELLAGVLLERSSADELGATCRFLERRLGLARGKRALDQCCGIGSLSIPLALRGISVIGVDQAEAYIERARRDALAVGASVEFLAGDAFEYVAEEPVDAVFNWWTSFGYTPSDEQNSRMLANAFESLQPGGAFALDFMNLPGVLRSFQPAVVTRRTTPKGELVLLRETALDLERGAMLKKWLYFPPGGAPVERQSSVRLYLPHTLGELLSRTGFEKIEFFGDTNDTPLSLDSPRCIAIARRPG